jgi:hypothetical protein
MAISSLSMLHLSILLVLVIQTAFVVTPALTHSTDAPNDSYDLAPRMDTGHLQDWCVSTRLSLRLLTDHFIGLLCTWKSTRVQSPSLLKNHQFTKPLDSSAPTRRGWNLEVGRIHIHLFLWIISDLANLDSDVVGRVWTR